MRELLRRATIGRLAGSSSAALAQRTDDIFLLKGGAFISQLNSNLRIDSNDGISGTDISFERDLCLDGSTVGPYALAGWRFAKNLRFEFEYFTLDRNAAATIDREIRVSGGVSARVTKNIGVEVDFRYVVYGLMATASDFTGQVNYNCFGPFLCVELGF